MSKFTRLFFVLVLSALAAGCATATSDPESTTRIESDPSGTTCTLENNKGYNKQIVTPTTVTLHRDLAPLWIACAAPGHASVREEFKMDGNAMVLGNILIGGLVGVAIDAASGAAEKFPDSISILLDPNTFDSFKHLDRWYGLRKKKLEDHFNQELAKTLSLNACKGRAIYCDDLVDDLNDQKKKEFKRLQVVRDTATITKKAVALPLGESGSCLVQVGTNSWEARDCPPAESNAPMSTDSKTTKMKIDGKETCLTRSGADTWTSGPCPKEPKTTEITVDGRKQCLVQVKPNTWESRPCPK